MHGGDAGPRCERTGCTLALFSNLICGLCLFSSYYGGPLKSSSLHRKVLATGCRLPGSLGDVPRPRPAELEA